MRWQVDLQSERGTNAMLYSTPAALDELKPGAHHDFVVNALKLTPCLWHGAARS